MPPVPPPPPPEAPSFGLMFLLGIGLVFLSGFLCIPAQSPAPLILAGLGAFISVFFPGWRGIFAGFASVIGLVLLAVVVICGGMAAKGVPFYHG